MLTTSFVFSLMYGCKNASMKNAATLFNRVCYSTKALKRKIKLLKRGEECCLSINMKLRCQSCRVVHGCWKSPVLYKLQLEDIPPRPHPPVQTLLIKDWRRVPLHSLNYKAFIKLSHLNYNFQIYSCGRTSVKWMC